MGNDNHFHSFLSRYIRAEMGLRFFLHACGFDKRSIRCPAGCQCWFSVLFSANFPPLSYHHQSNRMPRQPSTCNSLWNEQKLFVHRFLWRLLFFCRMPKPPKAESREEATFVVGFTAVFCVGCQLGAAEGNPPNYKQSMEQRFPFGDFSLNHYPSGNPSQCALFRSNLEVFVWMFLLVGLSLKMKVLLYHVFSR